MLPVLIDDKGDVWPEGSMALARLCLTDRTGPALAGFAVANLGFVHLSAVGRSVRVRFDRAAVAVEALIGLLYWASDHPRLSYVMEAGTVGPTDLLVPGRRALIDLVGRLCEVRSAETEYVEQEIAVGTSVFATLWTSARDLMAGAGPSAVAAEGLDALFDGHWTVSQYDAGKGHYAFLDAGTWYRRFDPDGTARMIGRSALSLGDPRLGQKVVKAIAPIAGTDTPRTHRVTARVAWGNRPVKRYDFSRLLVPVTLSPRRRLLISAAVIE